jgi:hypothetical protein
MKRTSSGRRILTSVAALTAVGGFFADWNRTHLFNPDWPPARQISRRAEHSVGHAAGRVRPLAPAQERAESAG